MSKTKTHTEKNYKPTQKAGHSNVSEPLLAVKQKALNTKQDTVTGVIEHLYGKKSNSSSELEKLLKETHLPVKTLAEQVFEVTPKTLNSYKISNNVPMHIRELTIKLSRLYAKGNRVFGTTENFNEWLKKKSYGLGGLKPIDLLNTITGIEMIFDELISIEFGTTA